MTGMEKTVGEMTERELIGKCIRYDALQRKNKRKADTFKAELQRRAIRIMDDRNIRYVRFYGDGSAASVTDSLKLEVLNMERLGELLGKGLISEQVTRTEKIDYKWKPKFERVLKVIFTGDYTFEPTLEEFLDQMSVVPDASQKKLLLKNLRGDYDRDRETLWTVLGYMLPGQKPEEVRAPDFDIELYYIYKIKNGELLRAYLPEEGMEGLIARIRSCILVESSTAVKVDYKKEDMGD